MKRRNFIGGLVALMGLGTCPASASDKTTKVISSHPQITSPSEDFSDFFKRFNGYEILPVQKEFFDRFLSGQNTVIAPRQSGATVLLITLAAWYNARNRKVIYLSMSCSMSKYIHDIYKKNYINNLGKTPPENLLIVQPSNYLGYGRDTLILKDNVYHRINYYRYDLDGIDTYYKNTFEITTI